MIMSSRQTSSSPLGIIRSLAFTLFFSLVFLTPVSTFAGLQLSLEGYWQFEMDPGDVGVRQEWFNRRLANGIRLPGILQSQKANPQQEYGNPIGIDTPWVLSLYDHFWYLR